MFQRALRLFGYELRSLAAPTPEEFYLFGARPTAAGVSVNATTCLESPTAFASIRVISEAMGSLPFHLYRRGANGERARERNHPAASILAGDFNPWTGSVEARTALQHDALTSDRGAAYALIIRTDGQARELHRLAPESVSRDDTGSEPAYFVTENGSKRRVDWRDMLVIATPGSAPGRPLSIVKACREAIGIDMVMAQHQARLFGRGAKPSGVLKHPKTLTAETAKRLKAQFEEQHTGNAAGGTLLLEEGLEFDQTQLSSVDAQFMELRRFAIEEVARAFKVPLTLVGSLDRAVFTNVTELNRQFVQACLMPWAEIWQAALSRVLLTPEERDLYFIEAQFDDLLRGDIAARFAAYQSAVGGPWLAPNEARALENRPPISGGDTLRLQPGQGTTDGNLTPPPKTKLEAVAA